MNVRVYVEGGGDSASSKAECRKAFSQFLGRALVDCPKPRVIACGGRESAYENFVTALDVHGQDFVILLVDSEDEVMAGTTVWQHLKTRDNWDKPPTTTDENAHLMVRCMETWLVADRARLMAFYGQHLQQGSLPALVALETVSKEDVQSKLSHATRARPYEKVRHGFALLGGSDPATVVRHCPSFGRLLGVLKSKLCRDGNAALA